MNTHAKKAVHFEVEEDSLFSCVHTYAVELTAKQR